jgi:Fe-S oxidoreductase
MRIGLFVPCDVDAFHRDVGIATLELLGRFGIEVEYGPELRSAPAGLRRSWLSRGIR